MVALLGALARAFGHSGGPSPVATSAAPQSSYEVPCPAGSVADFAPQGASPAPGPHGSPSRRSPVCVPVPKHPDSAETGVSETLPRRTDRPEDFARYQLPVDSSGAPVVPVGPGAPSSADTIHVAVAPQGEVRSLSLEHQSGPARVVFVGERTGWTVVTAHTITRERGSATVLLVHSGLASVEPALQSATPEHSVARESGAPLGEAGSEGLQLATRQLRRDVALADALPDLSPASVLATDVRNVLPLAAQ